MLTRQVQIDGRLFEVTVTEQQLDGAQGCTRFRQMRRETMPKRVRVDMAMCNSGAFGSVLTSSQRTLVVMGRLPVCQRLPGNNHSVGLRRSPRQ